MTKDFETSSHGPVSLFQPLTAKTKKWIEENVHTEPWQWLGSALAVEHRYIDNLVHWAEEAGLKGE